ncbi:uncharacterized protein CC84DRAFT_1107419 [Paraphaeosphaeria sporulosa]|uniref:Uncharacterized protein n=1 Tax=Paraphaeosphaeria sporulosa TaxID=1460663 RepID=A0A177CXD9_9PLEO|nr:uncharacterized protein CC84DRAFT_1107419 [Paraphaeosphaeria sporulosa]OAG11708.1 hypothetical protein CC84DRAFT_1107419 [Paraphaeosphaeria sporulosa]
MRLRTRPACSLRRSRRPRFASTALRLEYSPAKCLLVTNNKSNLKTEMSNPAGRPNSDIDVAASIVFLAGPGGVFYNEQILFPDGASCSRLQSKYIRLMTVHNVMAYLYS